MNSTPDIRIDLQSVIRERLPRHARFIPRFLVHGLERFIRQDEMNSMLEATAGLRDAEFCRGILTHLGITYEVNGKENLPQAGTDNTRVVFVCNHPLGGLDGMTLIDMLTRACGREPKFVVNDLLMAIKPLNGIFLPVNKHGRQGREASQALENAFEGQEPIIIFPAGLVSRKGSDGTIRDLKWQKMFVNRCIKHHRDIIPMFFSGRNSSFFYNFARLRTKLGIKFNLEMLRLPAEVFHCSGSRFSITVGRRIPWSSLHGGAQSQNDADTIKQTVYNLITHTTK